jgi:malonate transporter and related proteins
MFSVLAITAPAFFIIFLGYVGSRLKVFEVGVQKFFSLYVLYFAMPCYLFLSMAKSTPNMIANINYIASFALGLIVTATLSWLLASKFFKRKQDESVLAMMSGCYTNSAFIGIPIIIVTLFQLIFVTTFILTALETVQRHGKLSLKILYDLPKTILLTPIIAASLLGIISSLMQWPVPQIVDNSFGLLGNAGIPTALFALGLSLGSKGEKFSISDRKLVYSLVVIKNIIHPLIAGIIGHYIFNLSEIWLSALVVVSAMPTAMNNFVFAQRYGAFEGEASLIVFLSSVTSLFTLSILLWWFTIA